MREGRGAHTVIVSGEAGIGKSTVLQALLETVEGARVLKGECLDVGSARLPYAPLVQALRPVLRDPDRWGVGLTHHARGTLARLLPELATAIAPAGPDDPELGSTQLYEHLLQVVEQVAEGTDLLVLAVEDVHWSEPATCDLLQFLTSNLTTVPALLVLTVRGDEVDRGEAAHALLTALRRSPRATMVDLPPLPDHVVAEIVGGVDMDRHVLGAVLDRCGGNPLYALELAEGQGQLTHTLAELLLARVDRCAAATQDVLGILAAAGGKAVDHDVLAAVSGFDPALLRRCAHEAIAANLLRVDEDETYRFRHDLIADAVEARMLPTERRALHGDLAELLLADGGPAGPHARRLARHLRIARRPAEELQAAHAAALEAEGVFAHRDAVNLLERVAELWPTVPDAAQRTGGDLAAVYRRAAASALADLDHARTVTFAEQAIQQLGPDGDSARRAALHALLGRGHEVDWVAAEAAYRTAMATLPPGDSRTRAEVEAAFASALMMEGRFSEGSTLAAHAAEVAGRVGACAEEADALITLATIHGQRGQAAESARLFAEARTVAEGCGSVRQQMRCAMGRSGILANQGEFEAAIAECRRAISIARAHGVDRTHGMDLRINLLGPMIDSGRLHEALAIGTDAIPSAPPGSSRAGLMTQSGMAAVRSGDIDLARELMDGALQEMPGSQQTWFVAFWGQLATEVAMADGDLDAAHRHVRTAFAAVTSPDGPAFWAGEVGALLAEVVLARGGREPLGQVVAAVRQAAAGGETRIHRGERLRLEAIHAQVTAEDPATVQARWEEALAAYDELPMPQRVVRCHLALAELHLQHDRAAAHRHWSAAMAGGEAIGAEPLLEAARRIREQAGFAVEPVPEAPDVPARHTGTPDHDRQGVWTRTGDGWTVGWQGHVATVADAKGVRDIAVLLAHPGTDIHVFDLTGGGVIADRIPVLDEVARHRYARRIVEIDDQVGSGALPPEEQEELHTERDWLETQLRAAAGFGGRARLGADGVERARQAVGARIRYAIGRLEGVLPPLAAHLRHSLRLGTRCRYEPEQVVTWEVRAS